MVQTVELLPDAATDAAVRAQWEALLAAGLPSQARHTGATNAPHVTLGVCSAVPHSVEPRLADAVAALPVPLRLGGLVVFGTRRRVLARLVVPSPELLTLHAEVAGVLNGCPGQRDLLAPGRWTAHITLARGLREDQLGAALVVCAGEEVDGSAVAARRYDGDTRTAWLL